MARLPIQTASGSSRKTKAWERTGITCYDPRHADGRTIDPSSVRALKTDLLPSIGDCGFLRLLYDMDTQPQCSTSRRVSLEDHMPLDSAELAFSREVILEAPSSSHDSDLDAVKLYEQRRTALYDAVGVVFVEDNDTVSQAILDDGYQNLLAEKKSPEALAELEASTRGQGSNWR